MSSGPGEVRFNGEAIDLAYTYVQTSPRRYDNLAVLVNCPTVGVSPSLRVEEATDRGVLIVPPTRARRSCFPRRPSRRCRRSSSRRGRDRAGDHDDRPRLGR